MHSDYFVLSDLPSKFRSYPDLTKVSVRGLTFTGILNTSMFLNNSKDLKQLAEFYKDFVKLESESGVTVEDLEVMDFHYIMVACSLLTEEDFKWNITHICDKCGSLNKFQVEAEDLEYSDPIFTRPSLKLSDTINLIAPRVKSKIKLNDSERLYLRLPEDCSLDEESFTKLLSYVVCTDFSDESDLINRIVEINNSPALIKKIKRASADYSLKFLPLTLSCEKCKAKVIRNYNFDNLRGYL